MKIISTLVMLTLFLGGCVTSPPYNPFKIEKSKIKQMGKRLGLLPIRYISIDSNEKQSDFFSSELQGAFETQGFEIIPPEKWEEIRLSIREKSGDLYDPKTGKPDKNKFKKMREETKMRYLEKYNVSGFVHFGIIKVQARWYNNVAEWDGAQEASTGKEGFWATMAAPNANGTMGALSLFVNIESESGQDIFLEYGGIQLANHVRGGKFVDVPSNDLLSDEIKNKKSVTLATCRFFNVWSKTLKKSKYERKRGPRKRCAN